MTNYRKTILIGFGITIVLFIVLVIYPSFSGIQKESNRLTSQKSKLAELERKAQNLKNFQTSHEEYRANLEKIGELFINPSEPVNFIEFLEGEAKEAGLDIKILPFAPEKEDKSWPSMNFKLSLTGAFSDFLQFMERLESAPYLVNILNLNVTGMEKEPGTDVTLLIKVYAKD